jgi:hypothetical protein
MNVDSRPMATAYATALIVRAGTTRKKQTAASPRTTSSATGTDNLDGTACIPRNDSAKASKARRLVTLPINDTRNITPTRQRMPMATYCIIAS